MTCSSFPPQLTESAKTLNVLLGLAPRGTHWLPCGPYSPIVCGRRNLRKLLSCGVPNRRAFPSVKTELPRARSLHLHHLNTFIPIAYLLKLPSPAVLFGN